MHPLLILSILLFGTSLASSPDLNINEEIKHLKERLDRVEKKADFCITAFLTVHKARTFGRGSEKLYVSNGQEGDLKTLNATCIGAGGHIPSPKKKEENMALQSVVKQHKKLAFLFVNKGPSYTNWAEGEPNTAGGTTNYAVIGEDGHWRPAGHEEKHLTVCEFFFTPYSV